MVRVGLVGCGFIGSQLARQIQRRFRNAARLIGVYDANPAQAKRLARSLRPQVPVLTSSEVVRRSQLLIEAASPQAVQEFLPRAIALRRPMLLLSAGGLLQNRKEIEKAKRLRVPLYVPSGAIAGIDGLKAAAVEGLRSVTLTTRKPPRAFAGAPGMKGRDPQKIRKPRILFQGSALQAASAFPQNLNVAATLALAGIGPHRTRVRIIADPKARANIHEIEIEGTFGRCWIRTENVPSSKNPKTSRLAVQSAAATLAQIFQSVRIGT